MAAASRYRWLAALLLLLLLLVVVVVVVAAVPANDAGRHWPLGASLNHRQNMYRFQPKSFPQQQQQMLVVARGPAAVSSSSKGVYLPRLLNLWGASGGPW
jgi:hypothetical protein